MLEDEIRQLRARFWSDRDPAGRAFAPLADAYRRAGELDEATDLVEEGTDRLPDFAPGHLVRARVLRDRGDEEGAKRAYRRVLELDPENVDALREAAALAEDADRTVEAVGLWHRLARLQPADEPLRRHIRELKRRDFGVETAAAAEGPDGEAPDEPEPAEPEPTGPEPEEPKPSEVAARAFGPEAGEEADGGTEVYTRTMAELYARQGFQERAVEVYRHLVEERPGDTDLRARLEELERRSGAGASDTEESPGRPPPEAPDAVDAPESPLPEAPPEEGDVETLAREWAAGPGDPGELSTPFAWGREGESEGESAARPSIASYFQRMLEWPAGRDDETEGSPEEEVVPIEALAPDPASETPDLEGRYLGADTPPDDGMPREGQP